MSRSYNGITTIELLICLVISALLLTAVMPSLRALQERSQGKHSISALQLLIHSTRERAIHLRETVTLCPNNGFDGCHNQWNDPLMVFIDSNRNKMRDADELLLRTHPKALVNELRTYTGDSIQFNARGFSGINTGSFSYCIGQNATLSAVFVISRIGRIRRGSDTNNDGIEELASGQNAPCPQ